jgi:hypothetical protein
MKEGLALSKDATSPIKGNVVVFQQLNSYLYHLIEIRPCIFFCVEHGLVHLLTQ